MFLFSFFRFFVFSFSLTKNNSRSENFVVNSAILGYLPRKKLNLRLLIGHFDTFLETWKFSHRWWFTYLRTCRFGNPSNCIRALYYNWPSLIPLRRMSFVFFLTSSGFKLLKWNKQPNIKCLLQTRRVEKTKYKNYRIHSVCRSSVKVST